jgi:hypothetical protein
MRVIDVDRLLEALDAEAQAREQLVRRGHEIGAAYSGKTILSEEDGKGLRRAVKRWMKAARIVANIVGERPGERLRDRPLAKL